MHQNSNYAPEPEPAKATRLRTGLACAGPVPPGSSCGGDVPEKGTVGTTPDPLSPVPQMAQATAAAGIRSLLQAATGWTVPLPE